MCLDSPDSGDSPCFFFLTNEYFQALISHTHSLEIFQVFLLQAEGTSILGNRKTTEVPQHLPTSTPSRVTNLRYKFTTTHNARATCKKTISSAIQSLFTVSQPPANTLPQAQILPQQ
jgi:hypothetical protein